MIITPEELKTGLYPEVIEEITRADGKEIPLHIKAAEDFAKGFLFKYDLKALFGVEEDPPNVQDKGLKKVVKVMASYFLVRKSNPSVSLSLFHEDRMIWIGTEKEPGYLYDIRVGKINPEWPYKPTPEEENTAEGFFWNSDIRRINRF
ncbi:MAG: hypothetical protein FDW93_00720 [Bergeyella sp.]|nr:hypothetical protein [Bergeyella sp.]